MTDTPGRLLSSLSNVDGKPPKVGGCVSIFFHLFDWNRRISGKQLFSTKSLPAERPSSCSEKLPMAKLLLIADENRAAHSNSETQSEVGSERSSECGSSKKPGVVARLMGLESLPETEVQNKELFVRQQREHKHTTLHGYQELQMLEDLLQRPPEGFRKLRNQIETSTANKVRGEEKMPKNARKDQDPMQKFAKLPVSPKKSAIPFASLLSPSKNSNKVAPPIKSQTTSRRASLLMGAATRILEPGIQPSRSRPLLENAPVGNENSSSTTKGGGNGFHSDLERSLPKKQNLQQKPGEVQMKKTTGLIKGSASVKAGSISKSGSSKDKDKAPDKSFPPKNLLSKPQKQQCRLEEVVTQSCGDQEEHDDESLTDSQASSSKENRIAVGSGAKCQKVAGPPPRLSRSGSVKEEQPPTPPSRGSLFRSKSVREEAQSSPQPLQPASQQDCTSRCDKNAACSATTPTTSGGKEVRLKREKRQRSISLQEGNPEVIVQKARKPPLDQGRTVPIQRGNLQEQQEHQKQHQQKNKNSKQARNIPENSSKSSSLLSYDRLFKTRKQPKSSSTKEDESKAGSRTMNSKDTTDEKLGSTSLSPSKDKGVVNSQQVKSNDNSLMKSLLRRKPLSKAETVSSSKKKAVEKTKKQRESRDQVQHAYERQTRSGGSSPARNLARRESVSTDVLKNRNQALEEPALDVSPEKVHTAEKVHFEPDMIADKSLEEILKTLLSKSLGKASIGDSPLSGKKSSCLVRPEEEAVCGANDDDGNVIDMDLSPIEPEVTSRIEIDQSEDLPCKALQFEDDKQDITTPLALPLDPEVSKAASAEVDGGQPSPVSVLDFSALQSPFPSEVTVSCEEIEDGNKCALDSDAESVLTGDIQQVCVGSSTFETSLGTTLERYPNFPEVGVEEAASCEGQEIVFYVREVLLASGFISKDAAQTSAIPCTDEIFEIIENVRAAQQEEQQVEFIASSDSQLKSLEAPGSCHKLMHDCVAEALDLVLDPFRDESLTNSIIVPSNSSATFLSGRPLCEDLVGEVSNFVLSWREMTLGMVDDLVEVDMSATSGKWKLFQEDSTEIGVDLERMIFRSTMEDLIADLVDSKVLGRSSRRVPA